MRHLRWDARSKAPPAPRNYPLLASQSTCISEQEADSREISQRRCWRHSSATERSMLTLYDYLPSQNGYKIRVLLQHLGLPYRHEFISIFEGQGQRPDYLAVNPTGAVPAIRLDDGFVLAESNAILGFLGEDTPYLPTDRRARAKIAQWMSFEADYVQSTIGTLRHWIMTGKDAHRPRELLESKRAASLKSLHILDRELATRPFIAGDTYTIADISMFAYGSRAEEALLPLADFRNVGAWIARVKAQPGFLEEVYPYSIDPHSANELL
jgi:glutathione S-transferase